MDYSRLKTGYNERKFTALVIVQFHGAIYSHTQPSPGWPGLHQDPRPPVRPVTVIDKSS